MVLHDKQFLYELDAQPNKEIYAKIIALNLKEEPLEEITGKITGGSINIDGASAVRRTCSITLVAQDIDINNYYWGLNTKFKVEIGVLNRINSNYPDIIWFNQGIYLITSFNTSISNNNYSISISGKDKMSLLNGDIGGNLPASIDFGTIEETTKEGERIITKLPIKTIIKETLHTWAEEPYWNIIINDLDDYGIELLENKTDKDLYMFRNVEDGSILNMTFNGNTRVWKNGRSILVSQITNLYNIILTGQQPEADVVTFVQNSNKKYNVVKKTYGETVGYRQTSLTYAGELISAAGDTVVSILDKIKTMLGDFEYFYNVDGQFVFQRKRTYLNNSWNPIAQDGKGETYVDASPYNTSIAYAFEGNRLLTAISHNPPMQNIKNDFTIWGQRKSSSSASEDALAFHVRYAIDHKPQRYTTYDGVSYAVAASTENSSSPNGQQAAATICDWREIIYQMAIDFRKNNQKDDFLIKIGQNNPIDYPSGITGYEKYYTDMEGFWRQIYNPNPKQEEKDEFNSNTHWHVNVANAPYLLNFWFDFINTDGELQKYSIKAIGDRPKVITDSKINAVYFEETPTVLFVDDIKDNKKTGYTYIQLKGHEGIFSVSAQGLSAKDKLDELLYTHTYCTETISLTSVPIYYLEPNVRIHVYDEKSKINGDYIVSKITIPLTYNGTMSISATKAPQRYI